MAIQQLLDDVLGEDCTVILMCSDSRSDAYQLFQVLNDRGVHLGNGDLLRARTLEVLDAADDQVIQDQVARNWDDILAYTARSTDEYLRWYFSSMEGRSPSAGDLANDYLTCRFKCKEEDPLSVEGALRIRSEVERMNTEFATLDTMSSGKWPWDDNGRVGKWDRARLWILVEHLKHTNAMPLLLSLATLDPSGFAEAVACIERFVFRYKTIMTAHVSPMTKVYLKHAKFIRGSGKYSIRSLRSDLASLIRKFASDSVFEAAIREIEFSPKRSNASIRYFFTAMEDYGRWCDSGAQGVPKCRDKARVFDIGRITIDHIYPQNVLAGDKDSDLESVKHTLGNLTILDNEANRTLGNASTEKKLSVFAKSNLKLNRDIAENEEWTKTSVLQRTEALAAIALKIFVP